jgi:hypothetical protein
VFDVPTAKKANIVTLKGHRSIWEGDWELVKRSHRNESIWVVIHMCMEALLGISLYSYPYLRLAKMLYLSYYAYVFFSTKLEKRAE